MGSPAFVGAAAVSSSAFVARRSALSARPSAGSVARVSRRSALRMADEEEVRFFFWGRGAAGRCGWVSEGVGGATFASGLCSCAGAGLGWRGDCCTCGAVSVGGGGVSRWRGYAAGLLATSTASALWSLSVQMKQGAVAHSLLTA